MDRALSNKEIYEMLNGEPNIMTYSELKYYNNINDAMGTNKMLVLLYETRENYGHWCCVFMFNKNTIEVFDSYGLKPDDQLKCVPEYFKEIKNLFYPHLSLLLYKSEYEVVYNEYKLQKKEKGINTCGRWVVCRLTYKIIPQDVFAKFFLEYENPDEIVTIITEPLLLSVSP